MRRKLGRAGNKCVPAGGDLFLVLQGPRLEMVRQMADCPSWLAHESQVMVVCGGVLSWWRVRLWRSADQGPRLDCHNVRKDPRSARIELGIMYWPNSSLQLLFLWKAMRYIQIHSKVFATCTLTLGHTSLQTGNDWSVHFPGYLGTYEVPLQSTSGP